MSIHNHNKIVYVETFVETKITVVYYACLHSYIVYMTLLAACTVYIHMYSRTSIIQTPVCHFNVKSVQINEFVRISELSDKIHYLAS